MGWYLSVTLLDNGGNVTTLQYALRSADATAAATDSAAVIAALNAVTDSAISDYYIKNRWSEDTLAYPAAGVENENKASITCLLSGAGNKKANLKIPAPVIGLFTASSGGGANVVDMSDAALVTYTDLFRTGNECTISDGEDLSAAVSGKRISAKSNFG
jgi:hypothetical protein